MLLKVQREISRGSRRVKGLKGRLNVRRLSSLVKHIFWLLKILLQAFSMIKMISSEEEWVVWVEWEVLAHLDRWEWEVKWVETKEDKIIIF